MDGLYVIGANSRLTNEVVYFLFPNSYKTNYEDVSVTNAVT